MPREGAFQLVESWVLPPGAYQHDAKMWVAMGTWVCLLTATQGALQAQQYKVIQGTLHCALQSFLTPGSPPWSYSTDRHFQTYAKAKFFLGRAGRVTAP